MAGLRDWLNRVVKAAMLTEDVAGPRAGTRQVISGHPAEGLTPKRLASILLQAAQGEPEAYFELAEDIEERDPHYAAVMATRKRSVAQLPITVKAASDAPEHKKHAELIQQWIDDDILRASLFDILDAIGKGISVTELDWEYHGEHICPRKMTWRTQRWFTFDPADGETLLLREGVSHAPLAPHKFLIHRHRTKSGLTIRSGIARIACWSWMFKSFTVKDWALFVQNYGQPIRIGKYGRGATEAEKDVLWQAVMGIAGDCAAIMPKDMLVEFQEVAAKGTSTDLFEKRADWCDRQISKLVLGQTTTTDAISGGHAVSQEHRLVQEDIERSDALSVSASVNEQIIPNIIAFNFGPQERYPKILIGRPDEVPLKEFSEAFDKLATHGLTAEESYLRGRLGIPEPGANAVLVGGRAPAPVPVPGLAADPTRPPPPGLKPGAQPPTMHHVGRLLSKVRHAKQLPDDVVEQLADRLSEEAASALDGMIDEVRAALSAATDLRDAAERISRLNLSPDDLTEAMARGMALAHLAGQAALIDDLGQ